MHERQERMNDLDPVIYSEEAVKEVFTRRSSSWIARVIAEGQRIITERLEDGVME
jgi:hypothetical protein